MTESEYHLSRLLSETRSLGAAARLMVFQRVGAVAAAHPGEVPGLAAACAEYANHEMAWLATYRSRYGGRAQHASDAKQLDQRLDTLIGGLDTLLATAVRLTPPPARAGELAARLRERLLPDGAGALTKLPYVEQHAAVQVLLRHLDDHAEDRSALEELGHGALIAEIAEINEAYGAALHPPGQMEPGASLREANRVGMANLLSVVARVCGQFPRDDRAEDVDGRERYLDAYVRIREQDRRERLRRRRKGAEAPAEADEAALLVDEVGEALADAPEASDPGDGSSVTDEDCATDAEAQAESLA